MAWYYQLALKKNVLPALLFLTALIPFFDLLPMAPAPPLQSYFLHRSPPGSTPTLYRGHPLRQHPFQPGQALPALLIQTGIDQGPGKDVPVLPPHLSRFFNVPFAINRADKEALQLLPGIGPRMAERIIIFRDQYGFFRSAEDLMKVHGIGEKTAARLAQHLTFVE